MSDILNEVADKALAVPGETIGKKGTRSRPTKVRKHLVTTAYKNDTAEKLDKLAAAGHTVLAIVASGEVRGFEIITYTEE